ncbi:hypothetical protein SAMN06265360_10652 [Haloechinothrix alba]|uniref:Uncharacterized protein n=1 Tax=Haloechinothrix alba TaxID=664784 RepID=A0A238WDG5_9PSEU|nr:hypothetical protein [Haloechinothrix alba]SNR44467.1 hypothetical protein SAMN06265360_10652 [Haloechinothrix alba]
MSAETLIRCDDCGGTTTAPNEARWAARMNAAHNGWHCDDTADRCPSCQHDHQYGKATTA